MKYILELDTKNNVSIYPDENDLVIIDDIKFKELTEQEYKQTMNKIKIGYYPKWNGSLVFEKVVKNIYVDPSKFDTPFWTNKMEQEGGTTKQDFYAYLDEKYAYNNQLQEEEKAKSEAYELLLQENPNLTWEEFEKQYGNTSMMNRRKKRSLVERLEEPQIPESVVKFMEKYLGTTPTPKVETKPRTFSFDEVGKLNDTLKKL